MKAAIRTEFGFAKGPPPFQVTSLQLTGLTLLMGKPFGYKNLDPSELERFQHALEHGWR